MSINVQFLMKKLLEEESVTNFGGANFQVGSGEQYTRKTKKTENVTVNKTKDGKYDIYDDNKEVASNLSQKNTADTLRRLGKSDMISKLHDESYTIDDKVKIDQEGSPYDNLVGNVVDVDQQSNSYKVDLGERGVQHFHQSKLQPVNENYSRFRKETKIRTKSQQMREAVRVVEKKLKEVNKILEYTNQLRSELFENEDCNDSYTNKKMQTITKQIAEAYKKVKTIK